MGLLASLLSAVFSTSKDLVSKRLAVNLDGMTSTFASFAFALPYYLLVLALLALFGSESVTWSLGFLGLLFLRSVTDTFAEGMKMHAFAHADLSVVAIILSLSPVFLLITSPLLTGDPLTWPDALAIALVVGGSLLAVYRPSGATWASQRKGIVLAVAASVFFSLNSCFDRLALREATSEAWQPSFWRPVFSGFTMTLLSATFLLPAVLASRARLKSLHVHGAGLWLRGFFEVAFMVAKLFAVQYAYWSAPRVTGVQRLSLLLSIVAGRVFFREEDFGRRLTAGLLILAGVFLIAWLQW
jgi:drug/metabolite transporter (DMT)-like permease